MLRPKPIGDIDLVGKFAEKSDVESFMLARGWRLDQDIATIPGARYSLCYRVRAGRVAVRCDVHYDVLAFSHTIDLRDRLTLGYPTISTADLLLSKLQIARPSEADLFDMIMLLGACGIADDERQHSIIAARIASCCGSAWGLYTTVGANLELILQSAPAWLSVLADARAVRGRVTLLQQAMIAAPKTLAWQLRALFGKRVRWYDEIDAVGVAVGEMLY